MNYRLLLASLLFALIIPVLSNCFFSFEIEMHYNGDTVSTKCNVTSNNSNNKNFSPSNIALYLAAISTKAVAQQIACYTKKDPKRVAFLQKEIDRVKSERIPQSEIDRQDTLLQQQFDQFLRK
jgi:hypothetical protein